jgi:ectoine hydrolase
MAWLTGYDGWSFYVHQSVIIGPSGNPVWFGREQDAQGALRTVWMNEPDLIGYPDYFVQSDERHPMEYLAAKLTERGWHTGRIGVEMDNYWFSAKGFQSLSAGLPNELVDVTNLVNWLRGPKSAAELDRMRKAGKIVERMHARIAEKVEPGMRKCDLVADIYDASLRYDDEWGFGGDYPAIVPLLPSGADAAAPAPDLGRQEDGDRRGHLLRDCGLFPPLSLPAVAHHLPRQAHTAFLDAEKAVLEGMEAGLEAAKAGNLCEDIANRLLRVLQKYNIVKNNRTGYPIGLSYPPDWGERTCSLRPGDRTVLKPGMTFHFMTGLWMEGMGFEITESIVIGETGPECLSNVPRKMLVKD